MYLGSIKRIVQSNLEDKTVLESVKGGLQSWGSYFRKVASYKLLVTFIPCNLVTVIFSKVTKYISY